MRRTVLPTAAVLAVTLAAMLATLLALAAPAYPQTTEEDLAADEDGYLVGPRPPDYQVDGNGLLVIGGDVRVPCSEIGGPPGSPGAGADVSAVRAKIERSRRESIRTCRAAGFETAGDLPASASSSPGAPTTEGDVALPDTGGPALPGSLLSAAAVVLSAGGLLLRLGIR